MTCRDPQWLWLLAAVPLVLPLLVARERRRARLGRRFVAERLRGVANPARPLRPWLLALGLCAAIAAAAGPRFGFINVPIEEREANRILLLDVSNSMLAEDVGTSRLDAAKAVAKRIIAAHPGRIGLVIFESDSEVVSPLTSDTDAVASLLDSVQAGEIETPGSDVGEALLAALRLVDADPSQKVDLVLISDGEDQGRHLADALRVLKGKSIAVSTVLIGGAAGSTIPAEHGVLRDESGKIVTTYAHADVMQQIARETGGSFFENPFAEHALDTLAASVAAGAPKRKNIQVPIDRYQWPLAFAFFFFIGGSIVNRGAE